MIKIPEFFSKIKDKTGQDLLNDAVNVFESAKVKAQKAVEVLDEESTKVKDEIKVIVEDFNKQIADKKVVQETIDSSKEKAKKFLTKVIEIIG